ncbi:MAG TPA: hypothetical protein VN748_03865 [Pseudonocardiaceae bacterium]|nr:hypothetical protein [Pseudonocardiaceae bacterium]
MSLLTGIRTEEARALGWERTHLAQVGSLPPHIEVWRSVRAGGDTKSRKIRRTLALPPQASRRSRRTGHGRRRTAGSGAAVE